MVKTLKDYEHKLLVSENLLEEYLTHVQKFEATLLPKFLLLVKLTIGGNEPLRMIVMENVFTPWRPLCFLECGLRGRWGGAPFGCRLQS